VPVAGRFLGARVGGTDERQPEHGRTQEPAGEVLHAHVAELVAEVEVDAVGMRLHRVDDVREQDDVVAAEEARRECVEHAAALQQVGLGLVLVEAEPGAARVEAVAQVGQLLRREQHAVAAQPGDQRRVREQVEEKADQQVDQGDADGADDDQEPGEDAQHERDRAERALARIDEFIWHGLSLPPDGAAIGTPAKATRSRV